MPLPIEIIEKKFLKLHNVLCRELPSLDPADLQDTCKDSEIYANVHGFSLKGPLVVRSYLEKNDEEMFEKYEVLIQCAGQINNDLPVYMHVIDEMRIGPCLYARFVGYEENFHHTSEKLSLYVYEHGVKLTGETYTVHAKNEGGILTIDVFCPIE